MGFLLGFLSGKTKLYALMAVAFVAALLGWRKAGINRALEREQARQMQRRLDTVAAKKEINRIAETQDDTSLIERLTRKKKND